MKEGIRVNNYLLPQEIYLIDNLISRLAFNLNVSQDKLEQVRLDFLNLIKQCRDYSIEDILKCFWEIVSADVSNLMKDKLTPGVQFGIKNDYFTLTGWGGTYNFAGQTKDITERTYFSLDSISKFVASIVVMEEVMSGKFSLDSKIKEINDDYAMDATVRSILNFTAMIRTERRIDDLNYEETLNLLKKCKEDLTTKNQRKNFYEYNDIGYMILRHSINDFLNKLDAILLKIDNKNLIYDNRFHKSLITGGKISEEYITPDRKGRESLFPGHAGLYGNIEGVLNLFWQTLKKDNVISKEALATLLKQPYENPIVYDANGNWLVGKNNSLQYTSKIAGVYRKAKNINDITFNKLASCDISALSTDSAIASAGTCGCWGVYDNLKTNSYAAGILTNPYTWVQPGEYPEKKQIIPGTALTVNPKGVILGYQTALNPYKEKMTHYALILDLITERLKHTDIEALNKSQKTYVKKIED